MLRIRSQHRASTWSLTAVLTLTSVINLLVAPPAAAQTVLPPGRVGHVMAYDAVRGESVVLGGDTKDSARTADSLWAWNGTSWRASAAAGPSWRTLPAVSFDARRGRIVYFGGKLKITPRQWGESLSDTWEWDGSRWRLAQVNSPGALDHHAMTYDDARGVTVMYGGVDANVSRNPSEHSFKQNTWIYDGATWRMVADSSAGVGARAHHAMAYDSRRQRVVLFGGLRGAGAGDTWEWDGTRWQRVATEGPGGRTGHRMAYDAARGVVVLFGGPTDSATWTWDGQQWRAAAQEGPSPRRMSAMAYDARRQRVVLFGGGDQLGDLWEWDGTRWTPSSR